MYNDHMEKMTLLWERPVKFDEYREKRWSELPWKERVQRVHKRTTYRIVVSGSPGALRALLDLDSITPAEFTYRSARKPTKVFIGGSEYDLWAIVKGAPK